MPSFKAGKALRELVNGGGEAKCGDAASTLRIGIAASTRTRRCAPGARVDGREMTTPEFGVSQHAYSVNDWRSAKDGSSVSVPEKATNARPRLMFTITSSLWHQSKTS